MKTRSKAKARARSTKPDSLAGWMSKKQAHSAADVQGLADRLWRVLKARLSGMLVDDLAAHLDTTPGLVLDAATLLRKSGRLIRQDMRQGLLHLVVLSAPEAGEDSGKKFEMMSDANGLHRFGFISDTHFGSKYERRDVVETMFDRFEAAGIKVVYHSGNWIDGEARFNVHDLLPEAHGMQNQLDYFVKHWPRRKGIVTKFVTGDDHEGWYAQREGVDPGELLEATARAAGRQDLIHMGYKEAFVTLIHKKTGKHARLLVDHPGGGSAYADSYAAQKRVEAAQGGEKPNIWIFGHWHKLGYFCPRGVHCILAGCAKDLDPFGRKKGLRYDIGGGIIEATQDPQGGIGRLVPDLSYFYDRGYYNFQFDMARVPKKQKV